MSRMYVKFLNRRSHFNIRRPRFRFWWLHTNNLLNISYTLEEICKIQHLFDNSNLEELFTERGQKYGRCFIKKKKKDNIVVLEFIKPNYHKIQKKKTGSGSEADQALSLTTNLRRDSLVVSLHNWRYFLAFFRWAEASAKRARSSRHAPFPVARVRCSKSAQQPASRTLAFACLKNARK